MGNGLRVVFNLNLSQQKSSNTRSCHPYHTLPYPTHIIPYHTIKHVGEVKIPRLTASLDLFGSHQIWNRGILVQLSLHTFHSIQLAGFTGSRNGAQQFVSAPSPIRTRNVWIRNPQQHSHLTNCATWRMFLENIVIKTSAGLYWSQGGEISFILSSPERHLLTNAH